MLLHQAFRLLTVVLLLQAGCAATAAVPSEPGTEEEWGVRIVGIRLTAGGFMMDFRYQVTDAEKAAPLFDRGTRPYLVHQDSGARFQVPNPPKTGPLRTSDTPQEGRVHWMFFGNPGRYVKPGDKVTVVIGAFKAEGLTVE